MREELAERLRKAVSAETSSKNIGGIYLATFSNKILLHEAEVWCPLWIVCLKGACNVQDLSNGDIKAINSLALLTRENLDNVGSFSLP